MAPHDHAEHCFRAMVPEHGAVPVGPFGAGLFLRPIDDRLQGVVGQWKNAPNFTMLTVTCDGHPPLGRWHKPAQQPPADAQDKQSVVPLEPDRWAAWFQAAQDEAMGLLVARLPARFDQSDAQRTDQMRARQTGR